VNSRGLQDLIVYALAPAERVTVTNYPNPKVPTNIELGEKLEKPFGQYYLELFNTAQDNAGGAAVLTEYSWNTGSCDPCPGPVLSNAEIQSLGLAQGYGIVTRLHARYSNKLFKDDLVLGLTRHDGNFQGRYILRHPWKGAVKCKNPNRGNWGEKPVKAMTGNLSVK
jgi:hypothetical protein